MNRRQLLAIVPTAAASVALTPLPTWAQATPVVADTLPQTYADVSTAYEAARQRLLADGRVVAGQLFDGSITEVFDRMTPDLQTSRSAAELETYIQSLETNRVSFAAGTMGFFFDGQLDGNTIAGTLTYDADYPFTLDRDAGASGSPVASGSFGGTWTGDLTLGTDQLYPATVTLDDTEGAVAGSISVPSLDLIDAPLSGIAFDAERPIGGLLAEDGIPLFREMGVYWGQYAWGDRTLALTIGIQEDDSLSIVLLAPQAQLPPDPAAGYVSDVAYALPFDGLWWVTWGGEHTLTNYHAIDPRQRHAADAVIWNDGSTFRTDGAENTDYWIYGQPLVAPADGMVVSVVDGNPDNQPGDRPVGGHPAGNHVVIQTASEEFVFLAHMQPGSILVTEDQQVTVGTPIGLVGSSGNSSEPHLHIHLQNEMDFFSRTTHGLPLVFGLHLVNGELVEQAPLLQGTFVSVVKK